jgi:predicted enzyme related to lactoylglutathione lyase
MSYTNGQIIWHELIAPDVDAARAFYPRIVGWTVDEMTVEGIDHSVLNTPSGSAAAIVASGKRDGERPGAQGWVSYVKVDDVDAATDAALALNASTLLSPRTATGVGRFAILADPQGASFGLLRPDNENATSPTSESQTGRAGWHELYTADVDAACDFYAELFGWQRHQAFEMGPAGTYQIISLDGFPLGGMMRRPDSVALPQWSPFFQVADIANAERSVREAGGTIVDGLRPVPGGDWTVKCADNQGINFAMSGRKT